MTITMRFEQLNGNTTASDLKSSSPSCKSYLLAPEGAGAIIIDPVLDEVNNYMRMLEQEGIKLVHILETHTHADHISGAAALQDMTGAEIKMHEKAPATCVGTETRVKENDVIEHAGMHIKVIHTPGHTKDSVSYIFPGKIFTGDALFLDDGGAGRDDLPGGDPDEHYNSLQKLLALDEDLVVYPAHDYRGRPNSSLVQQKKSNPHMKKAMASKEDFIDYINNLKLGPADWMKDVLAANYACALDPGDVWVPVDASSCEVKGTLDFGANEQSVGTITAGDLHNILQGDDDVVLLDVREKFELNGPLGKLDGIVHVPITQVSQKLEQLEQYKDKKIVSICKIGGRSLTAGQILKQSGFNNIVYLEGGMIAWRNAFGKNKNK